MSGSSASREGECISQEVAQNSVLSFPDKTLVKMHHTKSCGFRDLVFLTKINNVASNS